MSTTELIRVRTGRTEAAIAVALYVVTSSSRLRRRGLDGGASSHRRLVGVERSLGIFWERGVQTASSSVPGLASVLGVL